MSFISLQSIQSENSEVSSEGTVVLDAEAYKNEGNRRLKQNDIRGSIEAYTKAIILSKTNYIYYNNRAVPYLMIHEYQKAIADCNSSLDLCKNVKAYCRKASALGMMGQFEDGITTVLKALDINPKDNESAVVLETLVKDKNKLQIDEEDNTPAGIAIREQNEKYIKKRASDLVADGKSHVRRNNFDEGLNCFTQAITLCPSSYKYYFFRAMAHKINGDYKKAIRDCEKSCRIQKNVEAYNLKASILSKMKKYDDAIDCIMTCLEMDSENKDALFLHEKISKEKLQRNRAPTMTMEDAKHLKSKRKKQLKDKNKSQSTRDLLKSPSALFLKFSSSGNKVVDEDLPWYQVPLKHTRNEAIITKGVVQVVDRYDWQDLPVEYNRVLNTKHVESRGAKTVRMKNIERKKEEVSRFQQYCSLAFVTVVGAVQRAFSTDKTRKYSVSPDVKRNRALTPVSM